MELFDSHCHLDDKKFDEDRYELIQNIFSSGVTSFITAGYSLDSSKKALELAKRYPQIYTTCGISPNDINEKVENIRQRINPNKRNCKKRKSSSNW